MPLLRFRGGSFRFYGPARLFFIGAGKTAVPSPRAVRRRNIRDAVPRRRDAFDAFGGGNGKGDGTGAEKFEFERQEWKKSSKIERSCFLDKNLQDEIQMEVEKRAEAFNSFFSELLTKDFTSPQNALLSMEDLYEVYRDEMPYVDAQKFDTQFEDVKKVIVPPVIKTSMYKRVKNNLARIIRPQIQ